MEISYTRYTDAITAFETIRRLLDPEMALRNQDLYRIAIGTRPDSERHATYRQIHKEIEADWIEANPGALPWNPFVVSTWEGNAYDNLIAYHLRDQLTLLTLGYEGPSGGFTVAMTRSTGAPFDARHEHHRRACRELATTVTEFNEVEGLLWPIAENSRQWNEPVCG